MSFFKYYRERCDADGEPLWWPGGPAGYPFRGKQPPQTKEEEYDNLKLTGKARCRTFYLEKPEDLRDYIQIRDKCANGYYSLLDRERAWDEPTKNYRIFLEWLELAYDCPHEVHTDAIKNITHAPGATTEAYSRLAGVRKASDW